MQINLTQDMLSHIQGRFMQQVVYPRLTRRAPHFLLLLSSKSLESIDTSRAFPPKQQKNMRC